MGKIKKSPPHNLMPPHKQSEIYKNHPLLDLQVAEQNHVKTISGKEKKFNCNIRLLLLVSLIKCHEVNLNK